MEKKYVNHKQLSAAIDTVTANTVVKTIKRTIGAVGVAGCDFNFATAANQTEQVINLGAIIPEMARIMDCFTFTNAAFASAVTFVAEAGTTSSGHEILASATVMAAGAVNSPADVAHQFIAPTAAKKSIYIAATPGANWSLITAGKLTVYITYAELTKV